MTESMGKRFRALVREAPPLQVLGVINAYAAMLAETAGAQALYLSGAGVANASYGIPDLGMTGLRDVMDDVWRVTDSTSLPLLVDIDTGWGHVFNLARTIKHMERAGVAAVHLEDQRTAKRCGHRPNKAIVSMKEMGDRIKACVDARQDPNFVIMARTDAYAVEGLQAALDRAAYCLELGADMIFPEALTSLDEYQQFTRHCRAPVLANMTEFGKTPLFTREDLKRVGVGLILYPLSAFRAMAHAALDVYQSIIQEGTQVSCLGQMQTRDALYAVLKYHDFEKQLDAFKENDDEA